MFSNIFEYIYISCELGVLKFEHDMAQILWKKILNSKTLKSINFIASSITFNRLTKIKLNFEKNLFEAKWVNITPNTVLIQKMS